MKTVAKDLALLQLLPRRKFDQIANQWGIDKGVLRLSAFKFTSVLIWSFIFSRHSLREIESSFGLPKSTLADALKRRPVGFFEDLFSLALKELLALTASRKDRAAIRDIIAIDSSTCHAHGSLWGFKSWKSENKKAALKFHAVWNVGNQWIEDFRITGKRRADLTEAKKLKFLPGKTYVFDRAYYDFTFWLQIKEAGSHFVTRLKRNGQRLSYIHKSLGESLSETGIIYDGIWQPGDSVRYQRGVKHMDIKFRHIIYRDPASGRLFDFITSDFEVPAQDVADIYKKRWSVELLFRWLKGHLGIRRFAMRNKNGIHIQLITAALIQILLRLKIETENKICTTWQLLRDIRCSIERSFFQTSLEQDLYATSDGLCAAMANCADAIL